MKWLAATPASILVLSLAFPAAPAAAQHDPPFVPRGAQTAVAPESGSACQGNGGVSMWPDGRSVLTWSHGFAYGHYRVLDRRGAPARQRLPSAPPPGLGHLRRGAMAASRAPSCMASRTKPSTFRRGSTIRRRRPSCRRPSSLPASSGSLPAVAAGDDGQFVIAWAVSIAGPGDRRRAFRPGGQSARRRHRGRRRDRISAGRST